MMRPSGDLQVYLHREPIDMRRGRNGLAALVRDTDILRMVVDAGLGRYVLFRQLSQAGPIVSVEQANNRNVTTAGWSTVTSQSWSGFRESACGLRSVFLGR